jgi:predicted GIY-YIG superfamily endonuclease
MRFFVYLISDGDTALYVGASQKPSDRFKSHLRSKFSDYPNRENLKIGIIEQCDKTAIREREEFWISHYSSSPSLLNKNKTGHSGLGDGGEYENIKFKKEVVDRMRENKKKTGVPIATFAEKAVLDKLPPVEKISQKIKSSRKSPKQ